MALTPIFVDGFDHYSIGDIGRKWLLSESNSLAFASMTAGLFSGQAFRTSSGYGFHRLLPATNIAVGGMRVNVWNPAAVSHVALVGFTRLGVSSYQCMIGRTTSGELVLMNTSVTGIIASTGVVLPAGVWFHLAWYITISDAAPVGSCRLYVNGALVWTNPTTIDTKAQATAGYDAVRIAPLGTGTIADYDDFYLCTSDGIGTAYSDYTLGDCRVVTSWATADGTYTNGTPSTGATRFGVLDETLASTTADYVTMTAVGDKFSLAMQDLPTLQTPTIHAASITALVAKDLPGNKSLKLGVRAGGTDSMAALSSVLGTDPVFVQKVFPTRPAGDAWTEADVNGAEAIVEVVAS